MTLPEALQPYADRTVTVAEIYEALEATMQHRLHGYKDRQYDPNADLSFLEGEAFGVRDALWALLARALPYASDVPFEESLALWNRLSETIEWEV